MWAAREVEDIRARTSDEIQQITLRLEEARNAYADDVASVRENALSEITGARAGTAEREQQALLQEQLSMAQQNTGDSIRVLYAYQAAERDRIAERVMRAHLDAAAVLDSIRRVAAQRVLKLNSRQEAYLEELTAR